MLDTIIIMSTISKIVLIESKKPDRIQLSMNLNLKFCSMCILDDLKYVTMNVPVNLNLEISI